MESPAPNSPTSSTTLPFVVSGLTFSILWASASAATKFGLLSAQPFVFSAIRFFLASFLMLSLTHVFQKHRLPRGVEWKQLMIYGVLNVGLYLGLFVWAMQHASAGLGTLFVASNPVLIALIGSLWHGHRVKRIVLISMLMCCLGMAIASWPVLQSSEASLLGIILLLFSMLSYSFGSIYFSSHAWNQLPILTINGWQTLFGGLFVLPFALWQYESSLNKWDLYSIGATVWLALIVSIGAVLLWLKLLQNNPINASSWLFLCPIIGFIMAYLLLGEPLSWHTGVGVILVIAGLYQIQRSTLQKK
jgi:probable blue pigment (indigoidine) exporter